MDAADVDAAIDGAIDAAIDGAVDAVPDAAIECPTAAICGNSPGVIYRDGCAPVPCFAGHYVDRSIDEHAESASLYVAEVSEAAYVQVDGAIRSVRIARYSGHAAAGSVHVAAVTAPGPTQGTAVYRTDPSAGDVTWVAWSESDGAIHVASRPLASGGPWTVQRDVAAGTRPRFAQPGLGALVLAYAGAGGIHVRRLVGGAWSEPVVIATEASALALRAYDELNSVIEVAWRTPQHGVYFARSRLGMPFVVEELESSLPPSPAGPSIDLRHNAFSEVVYSRSGDTLVHAIRDFDGNWQRRELGHFAGHGYGVAAPMLSTLDIVYVSDVGFHAAVRLTSEGPDYAEQVLMNRCGGGQIEVTSGVGNPYPAPTFLHLCDDGRLYWLGVGGNQFQDDWMTRCMLAARTLAEEAGSCGTDEACVIGPIGRRCGTGPAVDDLAFAATCGDATVAPTSLAGCVSLAGNTTCVPDGDDGVVVVPTACSL